jgi:hypothetical protein
MTTVLFSMLFPYEKITTRSDGYVTRPPMCRSSVLFPSSCIKEGVSLSGSLQLKLGASAINRSEVHDENSHKFRKYFY